MKGWGVHFKGALKITGVLSCIIFSLYSESAFTKKGKIAFLLYAATLSHNFTSLQ